MKNSFVLYTDYLQHINLLSDEDCGKLFKAIMMYASGEEPPDMDGMAYMAFSFIKSQIDRDSEEYQKKIEARRNAGRQGGIAKANAGSAKKNVANVANASFAKKNVANVPDTVTDNDTVTVLKENTMNGVKEKRFAPPTREEVAAYCAEKGYKVDADRFVDFYESKGWFVGKNKMKNWQAAVRNWARGDKQDMAADPSQRQDMAAKGNRFHDFDQRDTDYNTLVLDRLRQRLDEAKGG